MEPATTIRAANIADAENLAVLATQVWLDTYATEGVRSPISSYVLSQLTPTKFRDLLISPGTFLFVAERNHHLVGLAQIGGPRSTDLCDKPRQAEVDRLYVQEPFCRAGLGTKLMRQLERKAVEMEFDALWLSVWIHNTRARAFYEHLGFVDRGSVHITLENELHENRVLIRELPHYA